MLAAAARHLPLRPCGCHPLLPALLTWDDCTVQPRAARQWTRALPLVGSCCQNSFGTQSEVLNKHLEIRMSQPTPTEASGSKFKLGIAFIYKL